MGTLVSRKYVTRVTSTTLPRKILQILIRLYTKARVEELEEGLV